jgi:hypothetical protein
MIDEILALHSRGRALEELFFFKQNTVLIEKKQHLQKLERDLKTMSGISGISDAAVIRRLVELNVQAEVLATLLIIPLIEVAWADRKMDEEEREVILKAAENNRIFGGPIDRSLFDHWLQHDPPKGFLESWIFYMQGLCQLLSEKERQALKSDILQRARTVAEAGRQLPKSKLSRKKDKVLRKLESAFTFTGSDLHI